MVVVVIVIMIVISLVTAMVTMIVIVVSASLSLVFPILPVADAEADDREFLYIEMGDLVPSERP